MNWPVRPEIPGQVDQGNDVNHWLELKDASGKQEMLNKRKSPVPQSSNTHFSLILAKYLKVYIHQYSLHCSKWQNTCYCCQHVLAMAPWPHKGFGHFVVMLPKEPRQV